MSKYFKEIEDNMNDDFLAKLDGQESMRIFLLFNYECHWLNYIQKFRVPKLITTEGQGMTILDTTTVASNIFWRLSGVIILEIIPIIILIYITPILTAHISRGVKKVNLDINHIC